MLRETYCITLITLPNMQLLQVIIRKQNAKSIYRRRIVIFNQIPLFHLILETLVKIWWRQEKNFYAEIFTLRFTTSMPCLRNLLFPVTEILEGGGIRHTWDFLTPQKPVMDRVKQRSYPFYPTGRLFRTILLVICKMTSYRP